MSTGKRPTKLQQQSRQLLSCTKCRERKVKCDRTKPCSACCARGQPKDCHFVVSEGEDYEPIQQSYELRKLRAENLRLKERLRAGKASSSATDDEEISERQPQFKQKRFKGQDASDNLYFGSPGLASIINDFASLHIEPQSLSHSMPRGADIYAPHNAPAYPFATMWPAYPEGIPALLKCLPPVDELYENLEAFQYRAQSCSFPHTPEEITRKEIARFLADAEENAQMYPDMLALLFATLAQGVQHGVFDKCGGKWVKGPVNAEALKGDVYIAAAMQALRLASFMNRPTLLGIQTLIMIGPYLTNSGRFLDAWVLFGTTIRLAHSIGLHRNPKFLDPAPPLKECAVRQALWWWMLHMDQQYSMTLGRPIGISGIGDCPPPEPLTTNPAVLRLTEYVNQFTVLARQILSSDRLTDAKIDEFTDRVTALWDTMPEILRFDESWLENDKEIPDWPLDALAAVFHGKAHNYLVLLNRQRKSSSQLQPRQRNATMTPPGTAKHIPPASSSRGASPQGASPSEHQSPRGRTVVISSSLSLLSAFLFFYRRVPAALICWTMGQQAFNASMILLLDALETSNSQHVPRVKQAYAIFVELDRNGVHKLASLAVDRISWGLNLLRQREEEGRHPRQPGGEARHGHHPDRMQGVAVTIPTTPTTLPLSHSPTPSNLSDMMPQDTVMGNTGMLLLEDPGLQSFVPESFSPLSWDMAGGDLTTTRSTPPYQQQQQQQQQRVPPQPPTGSVLTPHQRSSASNATTWQGKHYHHHLPAESNPYSTHPSLPMHGGNPGWAARPAALVHPHAAVSAGATTGGLRAGGSSALDWTMAMSNHV